MAPAPASRPKTSPHQAAAATGTSKPPASAAAATAAAKPIRIIRAAAKPAGAADAHAKPDANGKAEANGTHKHQPEAPKWTPQTDAGREAAQLADRLTAGGSAEAPALLQATLQEAGLLSRLLSAAADTKAHAAREDAVCAVRAITDSGAAPAAQALLPALPVLLERHADKVAAVREAAAGAARELAGSLPADAVPSAVAVCLEAMVPARSWQSKAGGCAALARLADAQGDALGRCLPDIVPGLSECMTDAKEQVKVAAQKAMLRCCGCMGNRDLAPFVADLVAAVLRPDVVPDLTQRLSATTFVVTIEAPALAVMVPLLVKALREGNTPTRRKAAVIITNMSKLVLNPAEAAPFLPRLLPEILKVSVEAADPDLREVASGAHKALLRVQGHASSTDLAAADQDENGGAPAGPKKKDEELCNCEFSLAYGGRILLKNTRLQLRRGRRYGLCGANGAGKSTLMRAIAAGQLDGFPPKEVLRTVYVEHDIDSSEADTSAVEFVFSDPALQDAAHPSHGAVEETLAAVGFTPDLQRAPVGSLSGGWKMKLALARAMLMKADILLLDEPTNHLDAANVAWLTHYLVTIPDVSSMVVSHDSGFLDDVCTDIIHYEDKQLVHYPGNLSEFVKVKPEAKSYYELAAASLKFVFPRPGFLDGIKGRSQAFLKATNVTFSWPGSGRQQLADVNVRCSLGSRVAVLGANGAGKSTLIKLLTGETEPDGGTIWRHPNLRVAYMAQHAFHHVEQHLKSTPAEYFWWRFASGEDREAAEQVTRKITAAEKAAMEEKKAQGKMVIEALLSRRKAKKEFEYEVKWWGLPSDPRNNKWIGRAELEETGYTKMANDLDAFLAASKTYRPLSKEAITKHLEDFGMEAEIINHNHIKGLSGGQKVKLVLAAAMWNQPHLLVLDEPTNYLDRESLGALAGAIQEFQGAVLMISHNAEFYSALCTETWLVADGKVTVSGGVAPLGLPASASYASLADSTAGAGTPGGPGSLAGSKAGSASVASLSSLADQDDDDLDPEALEERLAAKAKAKLEKERIAAEKLAAKELKKKLRFAKRF